MNASLRDLKQHVDETPPPPVDVERIVARGEARLRRRRAALVAGSASLAVLAIATGVTLAGSSQQSSPPVDTPTPSVTKTPVPTVARPLTYTDDYTVDPGLDVHWRMQSIQYGGRTLRPGIDATALDLTDDGLVMVGPDGDVHFTDGQAAERIGELTMDSGSFVQWGVKTSTAGSLAAWFTPEGPERWLVVYDTRERRVLAQVRTPDCDATHPRRHGTRPGGQVHGTSCILTAVVGDRVYYDWSHYGGPRATTRLKVLDVSTEIVSVTDENALADDLRSHPRGFVLGDDYDTGEVVNQDVNTEAVFFEARGSTLELKRIVRGAGTSTPVYGYGGFDTTGRRLNLQLPAGYTPAEHTYNLFQWLDDDRFAVMAGATHGSGGFGDGGWSGYGDILVCDIARDRCSLAAPGPAGGFRLVPHLTLPN